jgi:histidyl-tRNA synthetase
MDKIGLDGVKEELVQSGFDASAVEKFVALFEGVTGSTEDIVRVTDILGDKLEEGVRDNLLQIISIVENGKKADFTIEFDPTLVRGMGYYTGTIFEIAMPEFGGSCGGGGRYDRMVGKFTGNDVPAVGFSIGFERIVLLLLERQMKVDDMPKKTAFLVDKGIEGEKLSDIISLAMDRRMNGENILVVRMNKNKKFQKEQLQVSGYSVFEEFYND